MFKAKSNTFRTIWLSDYQWTISPETALTSVLQFFVNDGYDPLVEIDLSLSKGLEKVQART